MSKEQAAWQKYRFTLALDQIAALARTCRNEEQLFAQASKQLGKAFPEALLFFGTIDPDSLAVSRLYSTPAPQAFMSKIYQNEFLEEDYNQFLHLAALPQPVGILSRVTDGEKQLSLRYREIYVKRLGMEHELRAALRIGKKLAGFLSLLRPAFAPDFTTAEQRFVASFCSLLEDGLRAAWMAQIQEGSASDSLGIGLVILNEDRRVYAANEAGERWMREMGDRFPALAESLSTLVALNERKRVRVGDAAVQPQAKVHVASSGRWLQINASRLNTQGGEQLSLIIEGLRAPQLHSLLFEAYEFTERERDLLSRTIRGSSTKAIARELQISEYTVQDHFKRIFDKTGVRSRRDLMAKLLLDRN